MGETSSGRRAGGTILVVVLLLVAAAAGGYTGLRVAHDHPRATAPDRLDAAAPIAADAPVYPSWAPYAADPTGPPLAAGLTYITRAIDRGADRWLVDLPVNWVIIKDPGNIPVQEASFAPRDALHAGYKIRVKRLDPTMTPQQMREQLLGNVKTYANFDVDDTDSATLDFTYRTPPSATVPDLHRRNILRWVTAPGENDAGLEISVSGRIADGPGLEDLLAHVAASARPAPK